MTLTRPNPVTLVVVEDTDEDFDTVVEAVERTGLHPVVRRATTGEAGLAVLRELPTGGSVLVLMDLNTPGTDGREALAELKADPALKSIPVIVFSTSASSTDIDVCYAAGANAYHVKPVEYPEHLQLVIDVVGYWCGRVELAGADGGRS